MPAHVSYKDLNDLDALAKKITMHFTGGADEDKLLAQAIVELRRKIAALRGEAV